MKPIELSDVKNIAEYEKIRPEFRKHVIDTKRARRVSVGPHMTFVFENRLTVLYQIEEMMRTERMVHDAAILHEIETYNLLVPGERGLSATLLIEITEKAQIKPILDSLVGLAKDSVYLVIGGSEIPALFDLEQIEDDRISAVQYIRWELSEPDVEAFKDPSVGVSLMVRHAHYNHFTLLTSAQRASLIEDLNG